MKNVDFNFVKKLSICLIISLLLVFFDQVLKNYVEKNCSNLQDLCSFFSIVYERNYVGVCGIDFFCGQRGTVFFVIVEVLCLAVLAFVLKITKIFNEYGRFISIISVSLIFGGGFGNLLDRIFRGFVVDYIKVRFFPYVFNFADICIFVGAVLLFFKIGVEKRGGGNIEKHCFF